jgi:hypothetical protein
MNFITETLNLKILRSMKHILSIIFFLPMLAFAQYHIDGPGTEACYQKIKESQVFNEYIKKLGYKASDIKMGYISARDYACDGKNSLRCDGDVFTGYVSLTTPKDKEGVYYKSSAQVRYTRINSYCNLQSTFVFDWLTVFPFQAYGKKASVKDEAQAKALLYEAFTVSPSILKLNPLSEDIVKLEDVKYDFIPEGCNRVENYAKYSVVTKSEGTADGGQVLVYTAMATTAKCSDKKDLILELNKYRVLINLVLDEKNQPQSILMEDFNDCPDLPENGQYVTIFKGDYQTPYDTLYATLKGSGIESVWGKTTQVPIPFSSLLFERKMFNDMNKDLLLLSESREKNKEILKNYVDEGVLEKWLDCLDNAINKKLTIVLEPNESNKEFYFAFKNKKGVKKGSSNSFGPAGLSMETGKISREIICQFY